MVAWSSGTQGAWQHNDAETMTGKWAESCRVQSGFESLIFVPVWRRVREKLLNYLAQTLPFRIALSNSATKSQATQ